jgi:hypothetical protein
MRYIKPDSPTMAGSDIHNEVRKFKTLKIALKELEPFIRSGRHLQVGDEFKNFGGLRSRELLGNWLLCVAVNACVGADRLTFTTDPYGGDGLIVDQVNGDVIRTEHVFEPGPHPGAPSGRGEDAATLVLEKIAKKNKPKYAGQTLVVFCNDGGGAAWYPNKVAKALPVPLHLDAVWVAVLHGVVEGSYIYGVTRLDLRHGNAPAWRVRIAPDFESWRVEPIQ